MNTCEKYEELISMMLDGELSENEKAELMTHIADCENCRRLYEDFAFLSGAIAEDDEEVPAGLHEGIMSTVKASPRKKAKIVHLRRYMGLAACFVLIVGAVALNGGLGVQKAADTAAPAETALAEAPMAPDMELYGMATAESEVYFYKSAEDNSATDDSPAEAAEVPMEEPTEPEAPAPLPERWAYEPGSEIFSASVSFSVDKSYVREQRTVAETAKLAELLALHEDNTVPLDEMKTTEPVGIFYLTTSNGDHEAIVWNIDGRAYVRTEGYCYAAAGSPEEILAIE